MGRQPEVLWAQRSDKIYLTVSLPDARDVFAESKPHGAFRFSAVGAQDEHFDFSLELYDAASKINIGMRNIICSIKKEKKGWAAAEVRGKTCSIYQTDSLVSDDENNEVNGIDDESSDDDSGLLCKSLYMFS
ncbi:CS domain [Musa troglodytarum]|uniref:Co-chaperone protein p23 n=1 Tax=Musa troglodytarum TaxID=320322 RepID=A0A9E7L982_9LILI|nr:CS domain [Musa troglodytarum]